MYFQGIFIFQMVDYSPASYGDYVFPVWADIIGLLIAVTTLQPFIIVAIIVLWKREYVSLYLSFDNNYVVFTLYLVDRLGFVQTYHPLETSRWSNRKSTVSLVRKNPRYLAIVTFLIKAQI